MNDDQALLRRFVQERSESDFAALVRQYVGLVYATALRRVGGDAHLAEDVAQSVFVDLARKAGGLVHCRAIAGWLYTSAVYAASRAVRAERRRRAREEQAHAMQELKDDTPGDAEWAAIRPVLDDALHALGAGDREAIVLRFFSGQSFAAVGDVLHVSESGARMRVERALEKLRGQLARRGIQSTLAALGAVLTTQAAVVPPAGLAATATAAGVSASAGIGGAALFLQFIAMTKTQAALTTVILAAGITAVGTQLHEQAELRQELAGRTNAPASKPTNPSAATDAPANTARATAPTLMATSDAPDEELNRLRSEASQLRARVSQLTARGAGPAAVTQATTANTDAYDLKNLDDAPRPTFQVPPRYPLELKATGIPGTVTIRMVIDETGSVADSTPLDSTHPAFTTAALEAVKRWKFSPGRKGDQPVRTLLTLPIQFEMTEPSWF